MNDPDEIIRELEVLRRTKEDCLARCAWTPCPFGKDRRLCIIMERTIPKVELELRKAA